ncbi:MAG: SIS domain-containing protein [Actinobacteria bacterium]|nr:MAG: SIS domain-containing protein [Actinomycetota bacterium]
MSWVEAELREQPAALERFLAAETAQATEIVRGLVRDDVSYLLIVSRGSSSNVARYLQYLFGTANRLTVAFATPSLYTVYEAPPKLGPAAVIGISQSGASPDVVAVLDEAKRQGRPTLAITNNSRSPLAETADWVLPLHAGEERAVAATKTYLNSIAAVALLSTVALGDKERLQALRAAPFAVEKQIESTLGVAGRFDRYTDVESGSVVTRGVNYGTAYEIALKIRELSGAPFEAFSSADLLHGPIAAVKRGRPAIVIAPSGRTLDSMRDALEKIRERGAELIAISDDKEFLASAQTAFPLVPDLPEWLSPLLTVVPGQVAAVQLAKLRGADIDSPIGLTKVTRTR